MLKSLVPWAVGFASWSFPTEDCGGGAPTRLSPSLVVVLSLSANSRPPQLSPSETGFLLRRIGVRFVVRFFQNRGKQGLSLF